MQQRLINEAVNEFARAAIVRGQLIEAGWQGLKVGWLHPDAPEEQIAELRAAFFAGAQHLFASIMGILDAGEEPTANDMRNLDLIRSELDAFAAEFTADIATKGNG